MSAAPGAGDAPANEPASAAPIRGSARFQVDGVYNIWGIGCVASGTLREGTFRKNDLVRVEPGPGSPSKPARATIHSMTAHRKDLESLEAGTEAGLNLRGLVEASHHGRHITWDLRKGDFLVYPAE